MRTGSPPWKGRKQPPTPHLLPGCSAFSSISSAPSLVFGSGFWKGSLILSSWLSILKLLSHPLLPKQSFLFSVLWTQDLTFLRVIILRDLGGGWHSHASSSAPSPWAPLLLIRPLPFGSKVLLDCPSKWPGRPSSSLWGIWMRSGDWPTSFLGTPSGGPSPGRSDFS